MSNGSCVSREDCWLTWDGEDAILNFSSDFLDKAGWQEGDELEFEELSGGAISIRKVEPQDD
jgi:hypothetical protein